MDTRTQQLEKLLQRAQVYVGRVASIGAQELISEIATAISSADSARETSIGKLDRPAKVGAVRFGAGVSERLVIEAAQRAWEYAQTPEAETERLANLRRFLSRASVEPAAAAAILPHVSSALASVAAERARQIDIGYDPQHDDGHPLAELISAAVCYAEAAAASTPTVVVPEQWPWMPASWRASPDSYRNLVKAAALLVAALDHLNRNKDAGELC